MTIGLALDWLKERRERRKAELYAEGYIEGVALVRAERAEARLELAEARQRNLELENRMLRAGIDPDTGQPLPHYRNGNGGANAGN